MPAAVALTMVAPIRWPDRRRHPTRKTMTSRCRQSCSGRRRRSRLRRASTRAVARITPAAAWSGQGACPGLRLVLVAARDASRKLARFLIARAEPLKSGSAPQAVDSSLGSLTNYRSWGIDMAGDRDISDLRPCKACGATVPEVRFAKGYVTCRRCINERKHLRGLDPEVKKRKAEWQREYRKDPEVKRRKNENTRKQRQQPHIRAQRQEYQRKCRADPAYRAAENKRRNKTIKSPENKAKYAARVHARRTANGIFTDQDIARIRAAQKNRCAICNERL